MESSAIDRQGRVALAARPSLLLHEEGEDLVFLRVRNELIAGLLGESLKILHRPGIGGQDPKDLPAPDLRKGLLRAQDGKRTIESAYIQVLVEGRHHRPLALEGQKLYTKTACPLKRHEPPAGARGPGQPPVSGSGCRIRLRYLNWDADSG